MSGGSSQYSESWPYNPLVTLIRLCSTDIIKDTIENYTYKNDFTANPFDLILQVMIVACSYSPQEIWLSKTNDVAIASELITKGAERDASEVLEFGIERERIRLNTKLIRSIARRQIARLHHLQTAHFHKVSTPTYPKWSLGSDTATTSLKLTYVQTKSGIRKAKAKEMLSGQMVEFRQLDTALSRSCAEVLHYLHAARYEDELAFGAFLENEAVPFAWVSYAPVGREYKQRILRAAGVIQKTLLSLLVPGASITHPKIP
jgi:hypothetical protein